MTGLAAVCSAHRPSVAQQRCQSPGFAELQREGQEHPHPTRQLHGRMKNGTKITQRFATSRTDIVPGYGSAGKPQFDRAFLRSDTPYGEIGRASCRERVCLYV